MWSAFLWLHLQYTSLRKCQPTLLAQVVLCRDVSVEQEQGINVEARRLCVTSGQSGWGYCWAASAVPVICRTSCSNFLIHPSLVLQLLAVLWISKDMIHRGMRTPCNDADSQWGMIKCDASHPKRWVRCRGIMQCQSSAQSRFLYNWSTFLGGTHPTLSFLVGNLHHCMGLSFLYESCLFADS